MTNVSWSYLLNNKSHVILWHVLLIILHIVIRYIHDKFTQSLLLPFGTSNKIDLLVYLLENMSQRMIKNTYDYPYHRYHHYCFVRMICIYIVSRLSGLPPVCFDKLVLLRPSCMGSSYNCSHQCNTNGVLQLEQKKKKKKKKKKPFHFDYLITWLIG